MHFKIIIFISVCFLNYSVSPPPPPPQPPSSQNNVESSDTNGHHCTILYGTKHQADSMFLPSAGTQCSAVSLYFVLYSDLIKSVSSGWDHNHIQTVLVEGTAYYNIQRAKYVIARRAAGQNALPYLASTDLNGNLRLGDNNVQVHIQQTDIATTFFDDNAPAIASNAVCKLFETIKCCLEGCTGCLITTEGRTYAILKAAEKIYFFDSHGHHHGHFCQHAARHHNDAAYMITFTNPTFDANLRSLIVYLKSLHSRTSLDQQQLDIAKVTFTSNNNGNQMDQQCASDVGPEVITIDDDENGQCEANVPNNNDQRRPETSPNNNDQGWSSELLSAIEGNIDTAAMVVMNKQLTEATKVEGEIARSQDYFLLDTRILNEMQNILPDSEYNKCVRFRIFLKAIFYIGKGSYTRPMNHLYLAAKAVPSPNMEPRLQRIIDIWHEKQPVSVLELFSPLHQRLALSYEACMISAIGIDSLTNKRAGDWVPGAPIWNDRQKRLFGSYLLRKAFEQYITSNANIFTRAEVEDDNFQPLFQKMTTPRNCEFCGKSFRSLSGLIDHENIASHRNIRPHTCPNCNQAFTQKSSLYRHMQREASEKRFACEICENTFVTSYALTEHKTVHDPDNLRKYVCSFCGNKFQTSSARNEHENIHTGARPFVCQQCGYPFAQRWTLNRHINTVHSDLRPYECNLCEDKFKSADKLNQHLTTHSRVGKQCPTCNKCFPPTTSMYNFLKHQATCGKTIRYKCPFPNCKQVTTSEYRCRLHYASVHKGKKRIDAVGPFVRTMPQCERIVA